MCTPVHVSSIKKFTDDYDNAFIYTSDSVFILGPSIHTMNNAALIIGSTVAQWYSAWLQNAGPGVRASSASLRCFLVQDTFILA